MQTSEHFGTPEEGLSSGDIASGTSGDGLLLQALSPPEIISHEHVQEAMRGTKSPNTNLDYPSSIESDRGNKLNPPPDKSLAASIVSSQRTTTVCSNCNEQTNAVSVCVSS
jgi:hypothetical protein